MMIFTSNKSKKRELARNLKNKVLFSYPETVKIGIGPEDDARGLG